MAGITLLCSLLVFSPALLTCFLAVTSLGSCVHIFRTVFSIHDMEIVQSAEDTGGIIGSPTKCKGAGMAPLTACFMREVIANTLNGPLWCLFSLQGKRHLNRTCPHPLPPPLPPPQHLLHSKPVNLIQNLDLPKDPTAVSSSFSRALLQFSNFTPYNWRRRLKPMKSNTERITAL